MVATFYSNPDRLRIWDDRELPVGNLPTPATLLQAVGSSGFEPLTSYM